MRLRRGIEIHLASDTRKAPEVLILEISAVAPTHNLHGNEILTRLQVFRNVEFCSNLRVFRIAYILAIHPEGEVTRSRTHVEEHLLTFPISRKVEGTAITARIVIRLTDIGRIRLEGRSPGIAHILIDHITIAIHLEKPWHRKIFPLRIIVLQRKEVLRRILMIFHEIELPGALH